MSVAEFGREVIAGFVANLLLRRQQTQRNGATVEGAPILTGEEQASLNLILEGLGIDAARMRDPVAITLATANRAVRALEANPLRKRLLVQYTTAAGELRIHTRDTQDGGIKLTADGVFIDEPPYVHVGEIWLHSDQANAVAVLAEWVAETSTEES